jgi:hypothetical protein
LGTAELAQGNYSQALDAFRQAVRMNPYDRESEKQAGLCERVLALDPDLPGLRAAERNRRSKELLDGVIHMLAPCQTGSAELDAARKTLAARTPPSKLDDATQENVALAARLWKTRPAPCSSAGGVDDATSRIVGRYAH